MNWRTSAYITLRWNCWTMCERWKISMKTFIKRCRYVSIDWFATVEHWKLDANVFFFQFCLQKLVCLPEVDKDDIKKTLESVIKTSGLETDIRNIVYHLVRNNGKVEQKPGAQAVNLELHAFIMCKIKSADVVIILNIRKGCWFSQLLASCRCFVGATSAKKSECNVYGNAGHIAGPATADSRTRGTDDQMGWIE